MKLLIIEDDLALSYLVQKQLTAAGFQVDASSDGEDGLYRASEFNYDLVIIDIGLPKLSGMEVISGIRKKQLNLPILILTARSSWQDKVHGLNSGADDYMVKPFQSEELIARVYAMLRRAAGYSQSNLQQGPITLDLQTNDILVNGELIKLTAYEYKLAEYFMSHPKKIVSKIELMDYLYTEHQERDSNVIEVLIARLRQKLDPDA